MKITAKTQIEKNPSREEEEEDTYELEGDYEEEPIDIQIGNERVLESVNL